MKLGYRKYITLLAPIGAIIFVLILSLFQSQESFLNAQLVHTLLMLCFLFWGAYTAMQELGSMNDQKGTLTGVWKYLFIGISIVFFYFLLRAASSVSEFSTENFELLDIIYELLGSFIFTSLLTLLPFFIFGYVPMAIAEIILHAIKAKKTAKLFFQAIVLTSVIYILLIFIQGIIFS